MAVFGMILLGLLALVLLLLCIPVALAVRYKTGEPVSAYLRWLFLKIDLIELANKPEQEKDKKKAPKKPKQPKKPKKERPKADKQPMEFSELLGIVTDLMSSARGGIGMLVRSFRFYRIRLHLVVAEEDAAETAIAYGRVNAAVYASYALSCQFLNMAEPDIQINPDFTAEEGRVDCEVAARMMPIAAIAAVLRIGVTFLVKLIRRKLRKEPAPPAEKTPAEPLK